MELLLRLAALLLYSVVVSASCWIVAGLRPGATRLLASAPLFAVSVIPTTLFDRQRNSEAVLYYYCVLNYLWLVNCKILALSLNRGPLVGYRHRPLLFTWLLIFPINVKSSTAEQKCEECNSPTSVLCSFLTKVRN